jgi:hypothetical protein
MISLRTNELIGFAIVDVLEMFLSEYLTNRVLNVDSNVVVATYDTGCIISVSPNTDYGIFEKLPMYDEIKKEMDRQLATYMNELRSTRPDNQQFLDQPIFLTPLTSGDIITASFLPIPPKQFDGAERYRPVAFVVQRMPVDVFDVVKTVESDIDTDIRRALYFSVAMGLGGLILVMAILAGMSSILTSPLTFITKVASQVINNALTDMKGPLNDSFDRKDSPDDCPLEAARDNVSDYNISRCTPKTELNSLVEEFQRMIQGFSGVGASNVAESPLFQIKNELVWHSDFAKLYHPAGLSKKSFRQASISTEASESMSGQSPPLELTTPHMSDDETKDQHDHSTDPSANGADLAHLCSTTLQHTPVEDNAESQEVNEGREREINSPEQALTISEEQSGALSERPRYIYRFWDNECEVFSTSSDNDYPFTCSCAG